jgi:hypothetical protein
MESMCVKDSAEITPARTVHTRHENTDHFEIEEIRRGCRETELQYGIAGETRIVLPAADFPGFNGTAVNTPEGRVYGRGHGVLCRSIEYMHVDSLHVLRKKTVHIRHRAIDNDGSGTGRRPPLGVADEPYSVGVTGRTMLTYLEGLGSGL